MPSVRPILLSGHNIPVKEVQLLLPFVDEEMRLCGVSECTDSSSSAVTLKLVSRSFWH